LPTFADPVEKGLVAPIPDLRPLAMEWGDSTHSLVETRRFANGFNQPRTRDVGREDRHVPPSIRSLRKVLFTEAGKHARRRACPGPGRRSSAVVPFAGSDGAGRQSEKGATAGRRTPGAIFSDKIKMPSPGRRAVDPGNDAGAGDMFEAATGCKGHGRPVLAR
jgi:hypothetical protein